MSYIAYENVVKRFDGRAVLDGLTLEIARGELVAIVGPSGTGKSVTLKHLVRLATPTSGRVSFAGVDMASCSERELASVRRRIGYLFQGGALLAWMTVAENVALPLRETTSCGEAEIERRVCAALSAVGMTEAAERYPAEISGGMQKRAALARAIVRDCEVVLYDEPTSGLDPVTSAAIHSLVRRLNRERGLTSVLVTHDLTGALAIADRIVLLNGGRVCASAAPAEFVRLSSPDVRAYLDATKGVVP